MLYSKSYSIMPAAPLRFGVGISGRLGSVLAEMSCKTALVVTDRVILELGIIDAALQSLDAVGIIYDIYPDSLPNPPVSSVLDVAELLKTGRYDAVIGAGGGSSMDTAKAGRLFSAHPKALSSCNLADGGQYLPRASGVKLITLPTLSGSGCEYMQGAVLTDQNHKKITLAAGDLGPDMAIVDPALQLNIPASVTAASAIDAMCHAFNRLCAPGCEFQYRNVVSLDAVKAIWDNLPTIVNKKRNELESRCAICYGSIMSGYIGGGPSGNFNHPIAHTISRFFDDVPHGVACAWVLPITLRHILPECSATTKAALAQLTDACGNSKTLVEDITDAFITWLENIGIVAPAQWESPISYESWIGIVPFIKEDGTWGMNPLFEYPDDDTLRKYLHEAYFDFNRNDLPLH